MPQHFIIYDEYYVDPSLHPFFFYFNVSVTCVVFSQEVDNLAADLNLPLLLLECSLSPGGRNNILGL